MCVREASSEEILVWQQHPDFISDTLTAPFYYSTTPPLLDLHWAALGRVLLLDGPIKQWRGRLVASFHLFSAWKKLVGNGRVGVGGLGRGGGRLAHQHISAVDPDPGGIWI